MFEHSVKVPRHFKIAANIFKKVSIEGGSVKTLLYDDKLRHYVSVLLLFSFPYSFSLQVYVYITTQNHI